jgi:hypothetical protein
VDRGVPDVFVAKTVTKTVPVTLAPGLGAVNETRGGLVSREGEIVKRTLMVAGEPAAPLAFKAVTVRVPVWRPTLWPARFGTKDTVPFPVPVAGDIVNQGITPVTAHVRVDPATEFAMVMDFGNGVDPPKEPAKSTVKGVTPRAGTRFATVTFTGRESVLLPARS